MTDTSAQILAAGALLWRPAAGSVELAVVHRPRYDDWSIPKGKLDPGESSPAAAVREVAEETGITVTLGRPLPAQHYRSQGRPKRVHFWASEVDTPAPFVANDEVDELLWLSAADARDRLSYDRDREVVDAFLTDPVSTTPLILLRHAHAASRSDWLGNDRDRPLTKKGSAEAELVAPLLGLRGVGSVIASPAKRCLDTVGPFLGWDLDTVSTRDWLAEEVFSDPYSGIAELFHAAASAATVVCGHRPVLTELAVALGIDRAEATLQPAGAWTVHLNHDNGVRVVGAERSATPRR